MSPDEKPSDPPPRINDLRARALNRTQTFRPASFMPKKQPDSPKSKKRMMPAFWYRLGFYGKFFSTLALIVVLAGAASAVYFNFIDKSHGATSTTKAAKKEPTTVASPLTGVQVAPELAARPVTAIMIENSTDARPQSGIQDAGIVFEAIAEGGITRFVSLYQEAQPQYIGPVRSLRPYYIEWSQAFDAGIAHVGGSPDALIQIRNGGKDLDQFFNAGSYWRQATRAAPHNVYTSFEKMDALNKEKGFTGSKFDAWPRKAEAKIATPTVKGIDLSISSPNFYVHYDYDVATNSYLRSEGGAPHYAIVTEDESARTQIHPKVVLAMVMPFSIIDDDGHGGYGTNGSGTMYVFQDGGIQQGAWSKNGASSQFVFTDDKGQALKLNPGQTWVTMIQAGQLNYSP